MSTLPRVHAPPNDEGRVAAALEKTNYSANNISIPASMLSPQQRVRRLRTTARCLGLSAVFVDDGTVVIAELFDGRGCLVEVWYWS